MAPNCSTKVYLAFSGWVFVGFLGGGGVGFFWLISLVREQNGSTQEAPVLSVTYLF